MNNPIIPPWERCPNTPGVLSGWRLCPLPWGACSGLEHPLGKSLLIPRTSPDTAPVPSFLSLVTESRGQYFSSAPHEEALWCCEVSPQSLLLQTEHTKASQLLGFSLQTLHHLRSLLWSLSSSSIPFIVTLGLKVEFPRATVTVRFAFKPALAQKSANFSFLLSGSRVSTGGERVKPILVALLWVGREVGLCLWQLCRCVLALGNDELAPWASSLGWTPHPACALRWGSVPCHWRIEHWCHGAHHQLLRNAGCFLQHS